MAIKKHGRLNGKRGNIVSYMINGQEVERTIGIRTSPPTAAERLNRERMKCTVSFLQPIKEFVKIGFALQGRLKNTSGYNMALSYNKKNAFKSGSDHPEVDFEKALVAMGDMPVNTDISIELGEKGVTFQWDGSWLQNGMKRNDTILMLAYCVEKQSAFFELSGARRRAGSDTLEVVAYHEPVTLEVYAAFTSADGKSISDSLHVGQIILEKHI